METEIEALVVRLTGDGSEYQKMLQAAQAATQSVAASVESSARRIEMITDSLKGFASGALSALASLGIKNYLMGAATAFQGLEVKQIQFAAVLRANGRDVESLTADYKAWIQTIVDATTVSGGVVRGVLQQAETFDLTGEAAKRASLNAINLSYATQGSADAAEQYVRLTAAMESGDVKKAMRFARMIPQLRGVKDETEFMTKANKLFTTGQEVSQAILNTTTGQLEKLSQGYKKFKVAVGEVVNDAMLPYIKASRATIDWLNSLSKETKTVITVTMGFVAALLATGPALAAVKWWMSFGFNPVIAILGVIGVAIAKLITSIGGITAVWKKIKDAAQVFWDWIEPAVDGFKTAFIVAWQAIKQASEVAFKVIGDWLQEASEYLKGFIGENKELARVIGFVVGAVTALIVAWKLLMVTQLLQLTLTVAKLIIVKLAMLAWAAVVLTVKAAVWLLNAALSAMNLLLVVVMLPGLVAIGIALYSVYQAAATVINAFRTLPTTSGPLQAITNIFSEWGSILSDVVRAAKVDMPLAWEIMKAGAKLGLEQIKALWPPLWEFIKGGFSILWDLASYAFEVSMQRAIVNVINLLPDIFGVGLAEAVQRSAASAATSLRLQVQLAETRLAGLSEQFNYQETAEVRKAREELARLRAQIPEAEAKAAAKAAESDKGRLDAAEKELQKFEGVLISSAEALHRITEFREKVSGPPSRTSGKVTEGGVVAAIVGNQPALGQPQLVGGNPAANAQSAGNRDVVEAIRKVGEILDKILAKPTLNVIGVNLG